MKKLLLSLFLVITGLTISAQEPNGYYDETEGLTGAALKNALHNIIDDHDTYGYDDLEDQLKHTDEDPNNSNNVILLYTGRSQSKSSYGGGADDWNKEHVWAKSHGDFGTTAPAGSDMHHLRPTDASVNSSRGNKHFAEGGTQHSEATGCYYTDDTWEPRDAVKGDVARMIFYMATRYEGGNGEPDLEVVDYIPSDDAAPLHGVLSDLLAWNEQDPPDDFERTRNNVIYGYQGNRNPYIDHPEWVCLVFGSDCPTAVNEISNDFSIYPNPAENMVNIEISNVFSATTIKIIDITGKVVFETDKAMSLNAIDVSGFKTGVYLVEVRNEVSVERQKLIIK
ncbi:MAG: endonuclease [Bacteroidales bacterium]|nr:endonuclease [Bacteroidales bacterium]